jgi:drug/metabolite transporter (DMT)-like permease
MNRYLAVLVLVTLVWGLTFPILKVATQSLSGVEISALRFLLAAACMAPFFWRVPRHTWRDGAVLGALALLSYVGQAYGLQFISSNRSAFLTSLNVIMVPLLAWAVGTRPSGAVFVAALLACLGIGLMSFDGGAHFLADTATILCALAFAVYVLFLSGRAQLHQAHQLAAAQMGVMALLGALWMFADSGLAAVQTLPERIPFEVLLGLLYLGLVASAGMFFLQALAQRHVRAEQAALVYALEPVFAAVFAWWWLAESLTPRATAGAALVLLAVVLSELKPGTWLRHVQRSLSAPGVRRD